MTDVSDLTAGVQPAAIFAAQGYVVVAPNFPGYDGSTLGYYPFLNADQNAIPGMIAARQFFAQFQKVPHAVPERLRIFRSRASIL